MVADQVGAALGLLPPEHVADALEDLEAGGGKPGGDVATVVDGEDPVEVLESAIKSLTPVLEVRSRRVGGATYQVPVEVPARRARTLAVRWLVQYARARREYSMADRLAGEILDSNQQQGSAWKRKDDIYRMAQANKAFAHYRW